MSSNHSIGAMQQLAKAFDKVGITPYYVTMLCQEDFLRQVFGVLINLADIVPKHSKLGYEIKDGVTPSYYSVDVMNELANVFDKVGIIPYYATQFRQEDFLRQVFGVLINLADIVPKRFEFKLAPKNSFLDFINEKKMTIWKGPIDGNGLEGEEDWDVCEKELIVDWNKVTLKTYLKDSEYLISGEEVLNRAAIDGNNIQLDGRALLPLWEDYKSRQHNSVLKKIEDQGVKEMNFLGSRLRNAKGSRVVLKLVLFNSVWHWYYNYLHDNWSHFMPSVSFSPAD